MTSDHGTSKTEEQVIARVDAVARDRGAVGVGFTRHGDGWLCEPAPNEEGFRVMSVRGAGSTKVEAALDLLRHPDFR